MTLVEAVRATGARRVLDVGCGTGATTLAIARQLAAGGRCVGADISAPMVEAARARASAERSTAEFICADVQDHAFDPAGFDLVVSRFGVMFFDDPARAFANLSRAVVGAGELRCVTWRAAAENPFMTAAERAAAPLLPAIPPREPGAPGQFALADPPYVARILEQAGWVDVGLTPLDVACSFPETELVRYFTQLGPLGRALPQADERTRARIVDAVRPAFDPYVRAGQVRFDAACWMVGARKAGR